MSPSPSQRLLIGEEAALTLRANATNAGEGAFEAELRVQLPPGTHYQAARSTIPVGGRGWGGSYSVLGGVWGGGFVACPWWPSLSSGVPSADRCLGMPRVGGSNPVVGGCDFPLGVPSGDGCQGMPSTGGNPNWVAHTVSFIPMMGIVLHGAAWWGWVPRDPGCGGSCLALEWLALSTGSPRVMAVQECPGCGAQALPSAHAGPQHGWFMAGSMTCPHPMFPPHRGRRSSAATPRRRMGPTWCSASWAIP